MAVILPKVNGRTLVIGDVHGRLRALQGLLGQFNPQSDDQLIFVGDLISRGRESREVVDQVIKLRSEGITTHVVMGNHEGMLGYALGFLFLSPIASRGYPSDYGFDPYLLHAKNGLDKLTASYGWPDRVTLLDKRSNMPSGSSPQEVRRLWQQLMPLPPGHRELFESLLPYAMLPDNAGLVVHAHLSGEALRQPTLEEAIDVQLANNPVALLWDRAHIPVDFHANGRLIFGHTPYGVMDDYFDPNPSPWENGPAVWKNKVAVDGGACSSSGTLVGFNPYTDEFFVEPI